MSYERNGFNPTDPGDNTFSVHHISLAEIGFHTVDFPSILEKAGSGQVNLVNSQMPFGDNSYVRKVEASLVAGNNYAGDPSFIYDARIQLSSQLKDDYTEGFGRYLDRDDYGRLDMSVAPFVFKNSRLLSCISHVIDLVATYYPESQQIAIQNQASLKAGNVRRDHRIYPPKNGEVSAGRQYVFFMGCLATGLRIAHSIDKKKFTRIPFCDFVITPDGPLELDAESGEYQHPVRPLRQRIEVQSSAADEHEHDDAPTYPKPVEQTRFSDLFGIESIVEDLMPLMIYHQNPEVAKKWGASCPRGVFLKGPGGVGKTSIVYALGNELGGEVDEVGGSEIYDKWLGNSQKNITAVFDRVREATRPTILFFDEFDTLINTTDSVGSGAQAVNGVAGIFKRESERAVQGNPNLILAAATNRPDTIDETLVRAGRFDIKIAVGLPNEDARSQIFGNLIISRMRASAKLTPNNAAAKPEAGQFRIFGDEVLTPDNITTLIKATEGFSGADIHKVLLDTALAKAIAEVRGREPGPITTTDLLAAIMKYRQNKTL